MISYNVRYGEDGRVVALEIQLHDSGGYVRVFQNEIFVTRGGYDDDHIAIKPTSNKSIKLEFVTVPRPDPWFAAQQEAKLDVQSASADTGKESPDSKRKAKARWRS